MKKLPKEIIIAIIIGLSILGYGWMNYSFKQQSLRQETLEKISREASLKDCLDGVLASYRQIWDDACEDLDLEKDCRLPKYEADSYEEALEKRESNCIKMFGGK